MSARFLGRRVYLGLAVALVLARPAGPTPAAARLAMALRVARRTLARWQVWWHEQFPQAALCRATCARFMPPVPEAQLPGELIERFAGPAHEALRRLLVWLSPVTVGRGLMLRSRYTRAVEHPQKMHVAGPSDAP